MIEKKGSDQDQQRGTKDSTGGSKTKKFLMGALKVVLQINEGLFYIYDNM